MKSTRQPWPAPVIAVLGLALLCQCAHPGAGAPGVVSPVDQTSETIGPSAGMPSIPSAWTRATARLAAAVPVDHHGDPIRWKFKIRPASGLNARSGPGDRVEVTSGLLGFVKNEAQLAAVLSHEMAHVFHRHSRAQMMESWAVILGGAGIAWALSQEETDGATAGAAGAGFVVAVNLTALSARRRSREYEADRTSLEFLGLAGYPAAEAVVFWKNYAESRAAAGFGKGRWWQSHPPDAVRLQRLQSAVEEP